MYRVLVADDEPIERMIVGRTIKKYFSGQLEVVEAVNGREAAKFFTEKDCKIALLDIEMPGVNGLEAAEQIREEDRDCSIIFLTAFDEFSYAKRAISVHALDYLLKPGTEEELVAVLEEAIRLLEEKGRWIAEKCPGKACGYAGKKEGCRTGKWQCQDERCGRKYQTVY